jgi:predicted Rossmann fold flavoprotein
MVGSHCPVELTSLVPKRLWKRLVNHTGGIAAARWGDLSDGNIDGLVATLTQCEVDIVGKVTFKEEFVTAGGIRLDQVNLETWESKITPGLYFAGEVLDVDGVTGGFNFQAAWSTGYMAGQAMATSR